MGKISPIANKYIIHASIFIEGVVDRPDVIGAIFGQTEGLLGEDLELRELQRSGRIGRIEVNLDANYGKTKGKIIIPSSLDKAETAIVGAALEIIQRIGPCNAKIRVESIEDVRILKRNYVVNRAKELLRNLMENSMPDSQELSDEVATSVRVMEIQTWGKDKLPAGPTIDEADEIILVEGRADVLNLLKYGFKNVIGMNGSNVPASIIELCKQKVVTTFFDGDRGGDLDLIELTQVTEVDFVTRAPDGKEVEELTKKEIHKALRAKIAVEQHMLELNKRISTSSSSSTPDRKIQPRSSKPQKTNARNSQNNKRDSRDTRDQKSKRTTNNSDSKPKREIKKPKVNVSEQELGAFKSSLESLVGTKGACLLDVDLNILGKVPLSELNATIKNFNEGVHAIVLDGGVDKSLVTNAESSNVQFVVGMELKLDKKASNKVNLLSINDL